MAYFYPYLLIAYRYWRSKSADRFGQLVTSLASIGIVLGVMGLIIVLSVMNGLEHMQKKNVLDSLPHAIVIPKNTDLEQQQAVSSSPFITKVVPINQISVAIQSYDSINIASLIGVSDSSDDPLLSEISNVASLLQAGQFNLIMSESMAQKLKVSVGSDIRLILTENSQYTPLGRIPIQRLFHIVATYHSNTNDSPVFANIRDVGRLLRLPDDRPQGLRLFLADPFNVAQLADIFPAERWQVHDWREQKGELFQAIKMEKNMMMLLISLIILVAISNIITSLSLMVVDKQGEIGILQTIGLTKGKIMLIFILQGSLVGGGGTILGAILGGILAQHLNSIIGLLLPVNLPIKFVPSQILFIMLFTLVLTLLSTLYPAYRASRIEPSKALRYE